MPNCFIDRSVASNSASSFLQSMLPEGRPQIATDPLETRCGLGKLNYLITMVTSYGCEVDSLLRPPSTPARRSSA